MLAGRVLGHRNLRMWAGALRLITAPVFACLMFPVLPFASGFLQKSYGFGPILVVGSLAYVVSGLAIWYFERE